MTYSQGVMRGAARSATIRVMRWGVLALALTGCALEVDEQPHELRGDVTFTTEERATIEVDPAFSPEERETVLRAVAKWATVVRDPRALEGWRVVRGVPSDDLMGYADYDRKIVWLRAPLPRDVLFVLSLHELGHAHGVHEHVEHGVMQKYIAWPLILDFTPDDVAECRREGVCAPFDAADLRPTLRQVREPSDGSPIANPM